MNWLRRLTSGVLAVLLLTSGVQAAEPLRTENVIVVMTDGLRWHEVFGGLDPELLNPENGALDKPERAAALKQRYGETPEAQREAILPFLWTVMAKQGQVFGNRLKGSESQVTNGLKFSYPGFSETVCGFADPRVNRNDLGPNPNVTVFEWLHRKPAFQGRVAAFGAWDAFFGIFNQQRCEFCVNAGCAPLTEAGMPPQVETLNRLKKEIPPGTGTPADALAFHTALAYFQAKQPRLFFLALDGTDHMGHSGKYEPYLAAATLADSYVRQLWETAQSLPQYRDKTTLIFTTDHGRGRLKRWKDHGKEVEGAEETWMAFLGPDTRPLGERSQVAAVTQGQIATTAAALLGEDYRAEVPEAAPPVADVLGR